MTRNVLKQNTVVTEQLLNDLISLYQTAVLLEGDEQRYFVWKNGLMNGLCGAAAGLGAHIYDDPYFESFKPKTGDVYWYPSYSHISNRESRNRLCLRPRLRKLKEILKDYTNEK